MEECEILEVPKRYRAFIETYKGLIHYHIEDVISHYPEDMRTLRPSQKKRLAIRLKRVTAKLIQEVLCIPITCPLCNRGKRTLPTSPEAKDKENIAPNSS